MNTANNPIILTYDAINLGKYKSTTHYQLTKGNLNATDLTELLNISADRECAKSSPTYWLQTRSNNKWQNPRLTGLFKTELQNFYKGDSQKKRNKIVFQFSNLRQTLTVYYFENLNYPGFYRDDLSRFKALLQNTNL